MLAGREDVQAHLFCLERDRHHGLDPLGLGGRATRRGVRCDIANREDPELRAALPSLIVVAYAISAADAGGPPDMPVTASWPPQRRAEVWPRAASRAQTSLATRLLPARVAPTAGRNDIMALARPFPDVG